MGQIVGGIDSVGGSSLGFEGAHRFGGVGILLRIVLLASFSKLIITASTSLDKKTFLQVVIINRSLGHTSSISLINSSCRHKPVLCLAIWDCLIGINIRCQLVTLFI